MVNVLDEYNTKLAKAQQEIDALNKQITPLTDKRDLVYRRIEKINRNWRSQNKNNFEFILFDTGAYEEMRQHVPQTQFFTSGYWRADEEFPREENLIKLKFKYEAEILPETIEFIEKWVQISQRKTLAVFRHDLCEFHSINIRYYPDESMWAVYDDRNYDWTHNGLVQFKGDLKDVLHYIAKNHWFNDGPDEDDVESYDD